MASGTEGVKASPAGSAPTLRSTMSADIARFALLGLGTGAVYAALGLAVVLGYRAGAGIQLSVGAMATWAAYSFWAATSQGELFLGLTSVGLGQPVGALPGAAWALGSVVAIAVVVDLAIYQPLRRHGPAAKTVASLGVLLVMQSAVVLHYGHQARNPAPVLPAEPWSVLGITVVSDRIWLMIITIGLAVALWALYRYSDLGLKSRAASENETGAVLAGFNLRRLELSNAVLGAVVAGGIGLLAVPIVGLDSVTLTFMVVPALAAALLGDLRSFAITAGAGLGLGMAQSVIAFLQTQPWWPRSGELPLPGLGAALPFVVIVVVLVVRGRRLPQRGGATAPRLPRVPARSYRPSTVAGLLIVVLAPALVLLPFSWRSALITSMIGMILCLSLVVVTGMVGQISLMQMGLAGLAGITMGTLSADLGIGFPWAPLVALAVAVTAGMAIAVPALRVRGMSLAVVTLAAGLALQHLVFENPVLANPGRDGTIAPPSLFGVSFGPSDPFLLGDTDTPSPAFGLFVLAVLVVAAALVAWIRRHRIGLRFLAVRTNEASAASAGIDVALVKVLAFGLSAALAGAAGILLSYQYGNLTAASFTPLASVVLFAAAYLGGITSIAGAAIGGTLVSGGLAFVAARDGFGLDQRYQPLVAAVALLVMVAANPAGIAGALTQAKDRFRRRPRPPAPLTTASTMSVPPAVTSGEPRSPLLPPPVGADTHGGP